MLDVAAEFGVNIPRGISHALAFARRVVTGDAQEVPELAAKVVGALAAQALAVRDQVRGLERELLAWYRASALARRIATVPGVGLLGALASSAPVASSRPDLGSPAAELQRRHLQDRRPYLRRLLIVGMDVVRPNPSGLASPPNVR